MEKCQSNIVRDSCINCALKHLGQAVAIFKEVRKGYTEFPVYVRGHMAEAEDELALDHPHLVDPIRRERIKYESEPDYNPDFRSLILSIMRYQMDLASEQLEELGYGEDVITDIQKS